MINQWHKGSQQNTRDKQIALLKPFTQHSTYPNFWYCTMITVHERPWISVTFIHFLHTTWFWYLTNFAHSKNGLFAWNGKSIRSKVNSTYQMRFLLEIKTGHSKGKDQIHHTNLTALYVAFEYHYNLQLVIRILQIIVCQSNSVSQIAD